MRRPGRDDGDRTDLDGLIEAITTDAHGDDEQLWAFRQTFEDEVTLPADGFVIGEPVSVIEFDYDGNTRRGLTARCRRADGSVHVVAASDVALPERSPGARFLAAYRRWLGLDPFPVEVSASAHRPRQHKATAADLDLGGPVELVVLAMRSSAARCRLLGSDRVVTLRSSGLWDVVPGEIVTVEPHKQWSYAGHPYLSGNIESARLDPAALDLVPLRLEPRGGWDPGKHYWGEEGEPLEDWARPIAARGRRPEFEMEQVLPGADPDDPFTDPITEAVDLKEAGDPAAARRKLMDLCQADLRCLDAHAHLGNLVFDLVPAEAMRHYAVGLRIGELSLAADFDGLLPWGHIDNRPFLRCMHGYGLCSWRLGRFDEAARVFTRMLWLNPTDNQGARFLLHDVTSGQAWEPDQDEQS